MLYTTRRGRTRSRSVREHRYLHAHHIDHTHIEGRLRVRHRWGPLGKFHRETWMARA